MATVSVLTPCPAHLRDIEPARTTGATDAPGGSRSERTASIVEQLRSAATDDERRLLVHELIETNAQVARSMAARYRDRGIDVEDLEQVALVGLTKAAQRFEPDAGHDFLSYAVPTVRGELRRHFRDLGWVIRVPRRIQELQARVRAVEPTLHARLERTPQAADYAAHLGVDLADVVEALSADTCYRPTSIDHSPTQGSASLGDLLGHDDPELAGAEARMLLGTAVGRLTDRERLILGWRFVDDRTQQEIGDMIGLDQAQVSRILRKVLARLRADLSELVPAA
ncbi:sigma-70 family RNA polymerase sigma factor [Nocardioides okcheonensis]|uniref:sigma-70 family RNA polymerase sigma factor n=1 Tax=Nocardioides okcheonensis TaxID=2894081 RepID=UPI001E5C2209|nr:sigma-70 family RNA polymerase sigma factor [Nocardioides okcheonensis]UFN44657.1 sigma-70 family RNA polymerase sigma factor [Nocardioides okcheonensis]